jgi:hypothetical protein
MGSKQGKVELGDKVRDIASGFQGIAVAEHMYINGCRRISIQPKVDKDGKMVEAYSFDEPQLEILEKGAVKPKRDEDTVQIKDAPVSPEKKPGGPEKYADQGRQEPSR